MGGRASHPGQPRAAPAPRLPTEPSRSSSLALAPPPWGLAVGWRGPGGSLAPSVDRQQQRPAPAVDWESCSAGVQFRAVQGCGTVQGCRLPQDQSVSLEMKQSFRANRSRSCGGEAQGGATQLSARGVRGVVRPDLPRELKGDELWGQPGHEPLESSAGGGNLEGNWEGDCLIPLPGN